MNMLKGIADVMASSGMKEAFYEYLVFDDCWQIDRYSDGNIIADPTNFPSRIKALLDYVHSKGLSLASIVMRKKRLAKSVQEV
mgnify:FL=1